MVRFPVGLRVERCKWRGVSARLAPWKHSFTQTRAGGRQEEGSCRKLSLRGTWTGRGLPGSTLPPLWGSLQVTQCPALAAETRWPKIMASPGLLAPELLQGQASALPVSFPYQPQW